MIAKQYAYAPTAKTSLPRRDKLNESSTLRTKKKTAEAVFVRRVLDSNQWIPYDIGSLANCWFQPLTQLSVVL